MAGGNAAFDGVVNCRGHQLHDWQRIDDPLVRNLIGSVVALMRQALELTQRQMDRSSVKTALCPARFLPLGIQCVGGGVGVEFDRRPVGIGYCVGCTIAKYGGAGELRKHALF